MSEIDYSALKKAGFMRQRQDKNFSLRLGIVGGTVTAEQLAIITEVSKKYGQGYIHLTSRQGIEIPYIKYEDINAVKEELSKGNVYPGASGPRVRTITACQGNAICQNACIDTQEIAKILYERYYGRNLPHKFKLGVTGCKNNCLKAEENDVGIKGGIKPVWKAQSCIHCGKCERVCRQRAITVEDENIKINLNQCNHCGRCFNSCPVNSFEAVEGYIVSFGGLFGNTINKGKVIIPFIENREKLLAVCDAALKFFEENAKQGERFKFTIDRIGGDKFKQIIFNALSS